MIISAAKTEDVKTRALILDVVEIQVRVGHMEDAKVTGRASADLAQKVKTHDYTREDIYLSWEAARLRWLNSNEGPDAHPGTLEEYGDNVNAKRKSEVQ